MQQAKGANDGLLGEFIDRQSIGPLSYSDMCLSIYLTDQFALYWSCALKKSTRLMINNDGQSCPSRLMDSRDGQLSRGGRLSWGGVKRSAL